MKSFKELLAEQVEDKRIVISPSPTADTRTCDWSKVTKEQLLKSSKMHIGDVKKGLEFFIDKLKDSGDRHDHDKISEIESFHSDFQTGFKNDKWFRNHKKVNRHHINDSDGTPKDIDLVDVIEYVTDCVMAGMARSGNVYTLELPNELLQKAFQNTVECLKNNVKVKDRLEK